MTKTERPAKKITVQWFEPVGRSIYQGPLKVTKVLLKDPKRIQSGASLFEKIILSVPASCGNAVKRNRFRRVLRELVRQQWPAHFESKEGLWFVLSRRFDLSRGGLNWNGILKSALNELK